MGNYGELCGCGCGNGWPENIVWILGWRPNHESHCRPWARKDFFCIPMMGVFELHKARKCRVGSGVAPRPARPLQNPRDIFWPCAVETPSSEEFKNTFASLWGTMVWVVGAAPQNPNNMFWHCADQTSPS